MTELGCGAGRPATCRQSVVEGTRKGDGVFGGGVLPVKFDQGNPGWAGEVLDGFEGPVAVEGAAQGDFQGGAGTVVASSSEADQGFAADFGIGVGETFRESVAECGRVEIGLFAEAEGGPVAEGGNGAYRTYGADGTYVRGVRELGGVGWRKR